MLQFHPEAMMRIFILQAKRLQGGVKCCTMRNIIRTHMDLSQCSFDNAKLDCYVTCKLSKQVKQQVRKMCTEIDTKIAAYY